MSSQPRYDPEESFGSLQQVSQDFLEECVGGSVLDEILSDLEYPNEDKLVWMVENHTVHLYFEDKHYTLSTLFDDNLGQYATDWILCQDISDELRKCRYGY